MTFPDLHFELYYDDQWNDHVDDVAFESADLTVDYGQHDEHGEAEPTGIECVLDNRDWKFSPKDPRGELYGKIGQGTRCRMRVGDNARSAGAYLPGVKRARIATPDDASLDITGDIDVRIEITPDSWRPPASGILAAKVTLFFVDNDAWLLGLTTDGHLYWRWRNGSTYEEATSTVAVSSSATRLAVRAVLDVNNGSGGWSVIFYTAPDIGGTWTQLGSTVSGSPTTAINANDLDVAIGTDSTGDTGHLDFDYVSFVCHAFQMRNGIAGTLVADLDLTTGIDSIDTTVTDSEGLVWTIYPGAGITDTSVRGTGAIPDFDPRWDETTLGAEMGIRAAGILEQLGAGSDPLRSSLYRDLFVRENIVGYWPLEDGADATSFAGGRPGIPPAVPIGSVSPASSAPLASTDAGPAIGSEAGLSGISGSVPSYVPTARQRAFCLVDTPDGGVAANALLLDFYFTAGSLSRAAINISPTGQLELAMFDSLGTSVLDTGYVTFNMNDEPKVVSLLLTQDGADIDWQLGAFRPSTGLIDFIDGTLSSQTYGSFTNARCGYSSGLSGTVFAHLAVINNDRDNDIWDTMSLALPGWTGEHALERQVRLATEQGQRLLAIGRGKETERLGVQTITDLPTLLVDEPAPAEIGAHGERRDAYALYSRGRRTMYAQTPALTLDMADGVIINPFQAPYDTQAARNDITVTRSGGSSYRAVKTSGAQSTAEPPEGLGGSYPSSPTVNLYVDGQLADQATWRLALGTVDAHRVASLTIEMHHHLDLVDAVLALRMGDLIRLSNPPRGMPPDDLDLIFLGSKDQFNRGDGTWFFTANCAPADVYRVGSVDDGTGENRADTIGSTLDATFVAGTDTTMDVNSSDVELWTTDSGQFPLYVTVSGVRLEVTSISGASNPQTFTVTQEPVNGVHKTIAAGEPVSLTHPIIIGL